MPIPGNGFLRFNGALAGVIRRKYESAARLSTYRLPTKFAISAFYLGA